MFSLATFFGCKKEKQIDKDRQIILDYLAANNITATETESGLFYVVDLEGTGEFPPANANVTVHYRGYFTDGEEFDSSYKGTGQPLTFNLNGVIKGWTEGIPKFKKGGKGKLFIPSGLGYGSRKSATIPANSVLIFDVHLIDFQ